MNIICYALSQKYSGANATEYSRYMYSSLVYLVSEPYIHYTVHMLTKAVASAPAVTGQLLCRDSDSFWDSVIE